MTRNYLKNEIDRQDARDSLKPSVARPRGFGLPRPVLPCTGVSGADAVKCIRDHPLRPGALAVQDRFRFWAL